MHRVFLSLGSNLGDRVHYLDKGKRLLSTMAGAVKKVSSVYETEPWGFSPGNNFLNMAALLETSLEPAELLAVIQRIESLCGRKSSGTGYSSRTLDIDILFFDDEILETEKLIIPHPLLYKRRFVLIPLVELSPDMVHPVFRKSVSQLLASCSDEKAVNRQNMEI